MSGVAILKRITICGVTVVLGTAVIAENRTQYQILHGRKNSYKLAHWNDNIDSETQKSVIAGRQPIVETMRKLFTFEEFNLKSVSHFFIDDLTYEDPIFRCNNKQELFDIYKYRIQEYENNPLETTKFEVVHSQDCMHILLERNGALIRFSSDIPSTVIVSFTKEGENEKVVTIVDEWNNIPLLNHTNSPIMGKSCILYRRFQLKFAIFRNDVWTFAAKMLNDINN